MSQLKHQVVQHIPRLRRYAHALLSDADRAEDLVQETLARALGRLHYWRRRSDLRAWLFTIMQNLHVNECIRAQKRPETLSLDEQGIAEPRARTSVEQDAELRDLETALMRLPEEQRAVLLLVSLEGMSYDETARILGVKKGTIMSRLHRARERMRKYTGKSLGASVEPIRSVKSETHR